MSKDAPPQHRCLRSHTSFDTLPGLLLAFPTPLFGSYALTLSKGKPFDSSFIFFYSRNSRLLYATNAMIYRIKPDMSAPITSMFSRMFGSGIYMAILPPHSLTKSRRRSDFAKTFSCPPAPEACAFVLPLCKSVLYNIRTCAGDSGLPPLADLRR